MGFPFSMSTKSPGTMRGLVMPLWSMALAVMTAASKSMAVMILFILDLGVFLLVSLCLSVDYPY